MQQVKTKQRATYILFGILTLFSIGMYLWSKVDTGKIESDGVFVIGHIKDILNTKNSQIYSYTFIFHGKQYQSNFSGLGLGFKEGDMIFVKLSKHSPSSHMALHEIKVPSCLTIESSPEEGWKKLPLDTCR